MSLSSCPLAVRAHCGSNCNSDSSSSEHAAWLIACTSAALGLRRHVVLPLPWPMSWLFPCQRLLHLDGPKTKTYVCIYMYLCVYDGKVVRTDLSNFVFFSIYIYICMYVFVFVPQPFTAVSAGCNSSSSGGSSSVHAAAVCRLRSRSASAPAATSSTSARSLDTHSLGWSIARAAVRYSSGRR